MLSQTLACALCLTSLIDTPFVPVCGNIISGSSPFSASCYTSVMTQFYVDVARVFAFPYYAGLRYTRTIEDQS